MSIRDPYTKLVLITGIFIFICAVLAAAAFAATPAFTAHKNGTNQTVANDTDTLLSWSTEGFDTNNNFATNRFTPTVAGKYLIVVSVHCQQAGYCMPAIRKNGTTIIARAQVMERTVGQTPSVTAIVDMNGSTDYVEAMATSSGTVIAGTIERTYFSGSQIDGAGGGSSQWTDGSGGAIYYNGGNVGIGTSAPLSQLTVRRLPDTGTIEFRLGSNEASARDLIVRKDTSAPYETHFISGAHPSADSASLRFFTSDRPSGERMVINHNGNVGIGTTSPNAMLHISKAGGQANQIIASDTQAQILISSPNNFFYLHDGTAGANQKYLRISNGGGNTVFHVMKDDLSGVQHTPLLLQHSTGNVGIGTANPLANLHVVDADTLSEFRIQATAADSFAILSLKNDAREWRWQVQGTNADKLYLYDATALLIRMVVDSSGNVGIGTASPAHLLHVRGTGAVYGMVESADGPATIRVKSPGGEFGWYVPDSSNQFRIYDYTAAAVRMTIDSTGNVGIGTTGPNAKLTVAPNLSDTTLDTYGEYAVLLYDNGAAVSSYGLAVRSNNLMLKSNSAFAFHGSAGTSIATINSSGTYAASDRNLKQDIAALSYGLDAVMKLKPSSYHLKEDPTGPRHIGFIAQEVKPVVPEVVIGEEGSMQLAYPSLVPVLAKAIQDLKADNDNLRDELRETINAQDAEIDVLRRQVEALKAAQ